ncbi:Hypoxic response protein 1 [archaeon HR06]|nr:Hypoxic response protein 1 [archaeon HR06]
MKVKDFMSKKIVSLDINSKLEEVARVMGERRIGSIVITEEGKPKGIITERDMVIKVIAKGLDYRNLKAKDIMSYPLITINKERSLEEAAEVMLTKGIRRLIVMDEKGEMVGIITTSDLARSLAKEENLLLRAIAMYYEEGY